MHANLTTGSFDLNVSHISRWFMFVELHKNVMDSCKKEEKKTSSYKNLIVFMNSVW